MQIVGGRPPAERRARPAAVLMNDHSAQPLRPGGNPQVIVDGQPQLARRERRGVMHLKNFPACRRPPRRRRLTCFGDERIDLLFQLGRFLVGFLQRQTGPHTGALVADVAEPGVVQQRHPLRAKLQQLAAGLGGRLHAPRL